MLIHETIECSNCKQEIKWFYPIPDKISDEIPTAYYQPKDEVSAYRKRRLPNSKYLLEIKCNYCNHMNELIYQSDIYL